MGRLFQIRKQDPCRYAGRSQLPWLAVVLALVWPHFAAADVVPRPELPQPEEASIFTASTPIGDLEYRPGRGLRLGDTGFTLGGFATTTATRLEGESGRFGLEDLDLFVFFDPIPYLHVFADFSFDKLLDIDVVQGADTSTADASIERLYGDLNLSDRVNFRLGRFLTPVGRWNQVPAEPLVWTTSRPVVTNGPFDQQVTGAEFWGSLFPAAGALTYTVYGQFLPPPPTEAGAPAPADNSAGARLEFTALQGWSVGGSYFGFSREGQWDNLGGLDALWKNDRTELSGEFLAGRGDPGGERLFGLYVQGVVEIAQNVYAVARYEHFDPGSPEPAFDLYDLGFAWRPIPLLILKADYLLSSRASESAEPGFYSSVSVLF